MARPKKYPDRPVGHVNVTEVCRILEISRATLYRYREAGGFPPVLESGSQAWFEESAIRNWAERRIGHPLEMPRITEEPQEVR